MEIIYVSNSEESKRFVKTVLDKGGFSVRETKNISDEDLFKVNDNEIILMTDDFRYFKNVGNSSYSLNNVIKVFLANISNDPFLQKLLSEGKDLMTSYKARDLLNIVKVLSQLKNYEGIEDLIHDISIYDYPITNKFKKKISGDLRHVSKDTLVYISEFIKNNDLGNLIDKDNVIIAASEIVDNIIELYINKGLAIADIIIEMRLSKSVFGITLLDSFGEANIYDISRSISIPLDKASDLFKGELPRERGRGYTFIRKTSDRVITVIVRNDSYHKYFFNSPCTSVTIVYYLDKKEPDGRLNTVIEFS
jgi:anti-sigma regulatory factor (Ser/Thr protein kinase)